jgi:hypothetical protein
MPMNRRKNSSCEIEECQMIEENHFVCGVQLTPDCGVTPNAKPPFFGYKFGPWQQRSKLF